MPKSGVLMTHCRSLRRLDAVFFVSLQWSDVYQENDPNTALNILTEIVDMPHLERGPLRP